VHGNRVKVLQGHLRQLGAFHARTMQKHKPLNQLLICRCEPVIATAVSTAAVAAAPAPPAASWPFAALRSIISRSSSGGGSVARRMQVCALLIAAPRLVTEHSLPARTTRSPQDPSHHPHPAGAARQTTTDIPSTHATPGPVTRPTRRMAAGRIPTLPLPAGRPANRRRFGFVLTET